MASRKLVVLSSGRFVSSAAFPVACRCCQSKLSARAVGIQILAFVGTFWSPFGTIWSGRPQLQAAPCPLEASTPSATMTPRTARIDHD
jgi:hypothetical protein